MKKIQTLLFASIVVLGLASCEKDKDDSTAAKVTTGVFVLNEGGFGDNNTTLTYFDFGTGVPNTDFYRKTNGSGLGDTGNDILIYGGKMYIVMNWSSLVQVTDAQTGVAIKKIMFMLPGDVKRQPRYVIPYKNKVLVSSYDGTVAVIDTTALTIEKDITVGPNPEQMAIVDDKLYVANSGAFNPTPDSTISVVNLNTFTEEKKIKAGGVNPSAMTADGSGNLYVACLGNFFDIDPCLTKINTTNGSVVKKADTAVGKIKYYDGWLYATGGYSGLPLVRKLRLTDFSQEKPNFVTDGTAITMPYGVNIDPKNGDVWITDAKDFKVSGAVTCFDKNGKKKLSFSTDPGVSPNTVVFIKE